MFLYEQLDFVLVLVCVCVWGAWEGLCGCVSVCVYLCACVHVKRVLSLHMVYKSGLVGGHLANDCNAVLQCSLAGGYLVSYITPT